jgi:hypothetical protein
MLPEEFALSIREYPFLRRHETSPFRERLAEPTWPVFTRQAQQIAFVGTLGAAPAGSRRHIRLAAYPLYRNSGIFSTILTLATAY